MNYGRNAINSFMGNNIMVDAYILEIRQKVIINCA